MTANKFVIQGHGELLVKSTAGQSQHGSAPLSEVECSDDDFVQLFKKLVFSNEKSS